MSNKQWLTVAECAKVLGVSKARIRQLLAVGRVQNAIKPGRDWVIMAPLVILPGKRRGPTRRAP
jgi:excisionase family DNA binding protein